MAVPKHKVSKAAGRSRRAANRQATAPTLVECPQCHEKKATHAVCPNCGYLNKSNWQTILGRRGLGHKSSISPR